jgi:hypothetical protein
MPRKTGPSPFSKLTVGIDNGTTGTVGIVGGPTAFFGHVPNFEAVSHVKSKGFCTRIDRAKLKDILYVHGCAGDHACTNVRVYIEAPFTMQFSTEAVLMAHRAYEAVLSVCDDLGLPAEVVQPKAWQSVQLGDRLAMPTKNVKGAVKPDTKKASLLKGIQLYPSLEAAIRQHGDADGLLIAHHYHSLR